MAVGVIWTSVAILLSAFLQQVHTGLVMPQEPMFCVTQPGDILLGYAADTTWQCSGEDQDTYSRVQNMEIFKYAIDLANRDDDLLPNITIGYVIMDTCNGNMGPVNAIVHFLPDDSNFNPRSIVRECSTSIPQFHIVGAIGPRNSGDTFKVAPVMSAAHIPILSTFATSDELSDPNRFEYSIRMSPPDRYQTKAILEFLAFFEWSYFGLIYSEGSYGENGAKYIEKNAPDFQLCVAFSEIIYMDSTDEDIRKIIANMVAKEHLRAVVLFMVASYANKLLDNVEEELHGRFVWIGSDGVAFSQLGPPAHGAFIIRFPSLGSEELDEYVSAINPWNTNNALLNDLWASYYECRWDCASDDCATCEPDDAVSLQYGALEEQIYTMYDATRTLLNGLHSLLSTCPDVFQNISVFDSCFTGSEYLKELHNLTFEGVSGRVSFDDTGTSTSGSYIFRQYTAFNPDKGFVTVADWNTISGVHVNMSRVNWTMFADHHALPISICSRPCPARHYRIQKEQPCCWECFTCRDNEIIVNNMTACEACPANYWPDEETATICEVIVAEYLTYTDMIGLALAVINIVFMGLSLLLIILLLKHRNIRLIKASSRELMAVIMMGILLAFITVFLILLKPTNGTCLGVQLGFHLSVTIIYAPLFLKTNRVYRIFAAGQAGAMAKMVSTRTQMFGTILLIFIQGFILVAVVTIIPAQASVRMPIWTERYSELYCNIPADGFSIPLSYNLVLLLACAIFGYKTRKLPENFNESWYIFVSVSTTVFLWLVFLPTYFTAFYATHQAALLATCLIINAAICLLCLFIPKIYAVYFVEENEMKFVTMNTAVSAT